MRIVFNIKAITLELYIILWESNFFLNSSKILFSNEFHKKINLILFSLPRCFLCLLFIYIFFVCYFWKSLKFRDSNFDNWRMLLGITKKPRREFNRNKITRWRQYLLVVFRFRSIFHFIIIIIICFEEHSILVLFLGG